jgi:hypothetical protein
VLILNCIVFSTVVNLHISLCRFGRWVKVKIIVCLKVKIKSKPKPNGRESSPRLNGKETMLDGGQTFSNGTLEIQAKTEDDENTFPGF